ncbi:MAG: hypothetical protein AAF561_15045 [Planctomycetota bacterium]
MEQATQTQVVAHPLDRRSFWLGVMAVIFAVLLAAHAIRPSALMSTASASEVADSREYQLVTSLQADGNEALYVLERRSGLVAMVQWDISNGRPEVIDVKPVQGAFGGR